MTQDRSRSATERGLAAQARVEELRELRLRLQAGSALTEFDLALAQRRIAESRDFADEARRNALAAHLRAARAHEQAAQASELAGKADAAIRHRLAALADEDAANG